MTIGTTDVLVPGALRSPAPPPPEGWGGRSTARRRGRSSATAPDGADPTGGLEDKRQELPRRVVGSTRPAWAQTDSAAPTRPLASVIGAATEHRPSSSCWSTIDQPWLAAPRPGSRAARSHRRRSVRVTLAMAERAKYASSSASGRKARSTRPLRRGVGGQPRADRDCERHQSTRGGPGDVQDLGPVEDRDRRRLAPVDRSATGDTAWRTPTDRRTLTNGLASSRTSAVSENARRSAST